MPEDLIEALEEGATIPEETVKVTLKHTHLNRTLRQALHKPKKDWLQKGEREICRSSSTLDVSDLVPKFQ